MAAGYRLQTKVDKIYVFLLKFVEKTICVIRVICG